MIQLSMYDIAQRREHVASLEGQLSANSLNNMRSIEGRADAARRDLTSAEAASLTTGLSATVHRSRTRHRDTQAAIDGTPMPRPCGAESALQRHCMSRLLRSLDRSDRSAGTFNDLFAGRHLADPYASRFESFGEFALAVANGGRDSRLIENSTMTTQERRERWKPRATSVFGSDPRRSLRQEGHPAAR
jgi:hypothetical protein